MVSAKDSPIDNTTCRSLCRCREPVFRHLRRAGSRADRHRRTAGTAETVAVVLHKDEKAIQKSDVGVGSPRSRSRSARTSRSCTSTGSSPAPRQRAFKPYRAEGLATYRKNQWIPLAPDIAQFVITPTLGFTYQVTERVARFFGGTKGNYGIAIILLTVLVRGLMFPIGRKQALLGPEDAEPPASFERASRTSSRTTRNS